MASDDDDEYDEDYQDKGRLDDDLLRKIGMLCQKSVEYKRIIKRLKIPATATSSQRAPRELPKSSQRAPRELPSKALVKYVS